LVELGRERLLHLRAAHVLLVLLLRLILGRKVRKALELWRSESRGRARLEGAAEEQLRGQQRRKVHVKPSARCLQVGNVVAAARCKAICVDGRNVGPLRVPVGIACLVRVEGSVGEARISPVHVLVVLLLLLLLLLLLMTGSARSVRGAVVVLHSEEVRGQEVVPRVLGEDSRCDGVLLRPVLKEPRTAKYVE